VTELTESTELTWAGLHREVAGVLGDQEARWIVEEASGHDLADVAARAVPERGVAAVDRMVGRRTSGEPIQYVLGSWAFRTLDLMVDRRVLIPRPETEVVAGHALAELDRAGGRLLVDLGTGSGAIGLAVAAERAHAEVWLTDASPDALAVARANIAGLGRAGVRVTVAEGRWFDALPPDAAGTIDVVVSNPPYVAEHEDLPASVADWEPAGALVAGPEGTEDLVHLIDTAPAWLAPGGALVLELAPWQAEPMAERARRRFAEVRVEKDLAGLDRVLVARG
jgi:release factor glutamine methyltransferase